MIHFIIYVRWEMTHFISGDDPLSVPYAWVEIYIHTDVFYEAYLYLHAAIYAECLQILDHFLLNT